MMKKSTFDCDALQNILYFMDLQEICTEVKVCPQEGWKEVS